MRIFDIFRGRKETKPTGDVSHSQGKHDEQVFRHEATAATANPGAPIGSTQETQALAASLEEGRKLQIQIIKDKMERM